MASPDRIGVRLPDGTVSDLELPFSLVRALRALGESSVVLVAATPKEAHRRTVGRPAAPRIVPTG